jgi:hypothetical protein
VGSCSRVITVYQRLFLPSAQPPEADVARLLRVADALGGRVSLIIKVNEGLARCRRDADNAARAFSGFDHTCR